MTRPATSPLRVMRRLLRGLPWATIWDDGDAGTVIRNAMDPCQWLCWDLGLDVRGYLAEESLAAILRSSRPLTRCNQIRARLLRRIGVPAEALWSYPGDHL